MLTHAISIVGDRADPASDHEIERLLHRAYVEPGFTEPQLGASLFAAAAVRKRGQLLLARERVGRAVVGMIIAVPSSSPAKRMADANEMEIHLLAVAPERRNTGVGTALVDAALSSARRLAYERVVLWTQPAMAAARRLYERAGFVRAPDRDWRRGARSFLVYERTL